MVETDLGEFIVQLAGEAPEHIIIAGDPQEPRRRCATCSSRSPGGRSAPSPTDLIAFARGTCGSASCRPPVGVTGVNFAVAETGTVVLVTNEGNGRMCSALPRVHIAVMGMERVVAQLSDLAVLLPLLTRSATGQKISSYVSMISGPRRDGEGDGPDEMHVVILDNGRSRVREHRATAACSTASAAAPARTSARCTARSAAPPTAGCTAARSAPS